VPPKAGLPARPAERRRIRVDRRSGRSPGGRRHRRPRSRCPVAPGSRLSGPKSGRARRPAGLRRATTGSQQVAVTSSPRTDGRWHVPGRPVPATGARKTLSRPERRGPSTSRACSPLPRGPGTRRRRVSRASRGAERDEGAARQTPAGRRWRTRPATHRCPSTMPHHGRCRALARKRASAPARVPVPQDEGVRRGRPGPASDPARIALANDFNVGSR